MIYAETSRLILRSLEKSDLPRIVELIGDWDVARWLVSVPVPYTLRHAEEFYERMNEAARCGTPEYFLLERTGDGEQIGAIGLHVHREPFPQNDELVIGYWVGKAFWGQGYISEAIQPIIAHAFDRSEVRLLSSTTDPENAASQNVLRKAGFTYLGISTRKESDAYNNKPLRGGMDVTRWQMTREDYLQRKKSA